jgi:hypothetical protein
MTVFVPFAPPAIGNAFVAPNTDPTTDKASRTQHILLEQTGNSHEEKRVTATSEWVMRTVDFTDRLLLDMSYDTAHIEMLS